MAYQFSFYYNPLYYNVSSTKPVVADDSNPVELLKDRSRLSYYSHESTSTIIYVDLFNLITISGIYIAGILNSDIDQINISYSNDGGSSYISTETIQDSMYLYEANKETYVDDMLLLDNSFTSHDYIHNVQEASSVNYLKIEVINTSISNITIGMLRVFMNKYTLPRGILSDHSRYPMTVHERLQINDGYEVRRPKTQLQKLNGLVQCKADQFYTMFINLTKLPVLYMSVDDASNVDTIYGNVELSQEGREYNLLTIRMDITEVK